ncbi:TetR/AcrR family transcriptional regulator [Actinoplanes sp. NPDC051513]|uniref:TetR/AcrR family transcriptional regulator n=1 Tax=Actinoplanes sp. NPDC051513 TaxID=3363908 RepID=UPI0037AEACF4
MPRRASNETTRTTKRLTKQKIVTEAIALADADGLDGLSMRRLAQHLAVDPMSLYYHVRDKDALLAEMADAVVAEISPVPRTGSWIEQLRELIMAARATMVRHPWAARVLEGRDTPTPAVMLHLERVLAIMRGGGCSVDLGHHAIHLFGSRLLGFSQDLFDDDPDTAPPPDAVAAWATTMPHIVELATAVTHDGALGGCDDDGEFAFALDLLLEGLEKRRAGKTTS